MKKINLIILFLSVFIYAQEYQITNVPVIQYSIDRYTNEIYYKNHVTGDIYKTNFQGTSHMLTKFTSVPQFANNNHTASYIDRHSQTDKDLYLYDFEIDTSYFLANYSYLTSIMYFTPLDDKILFGGGAKIIYYSFADSSVHNTGLTIYTDVVDWLTDTTIVYITLGGVDIRTININNLNENIVVQAPYLVSIRGLAANTNIDAFAYSWEYNSAENSFINLYYPQTGLDTTVYNFQEQGPNPGGGNINILIRDLSWEISSNKLGFIGEVPLISLSLIYVFEYSSFNTYLYSDLHTLWEGIKYDLQWLNKDTVTYADWTDGGFLFGLDVTVPLSVDEYLNLIVDNFDIKVYPNPFNNETQITLNVPTTGKLRIELYNCLGESMGKESYDYVSAGNFEIDWNEIRDYKNLPTGIYFIRALFNDKEHSIQKTVKLVYLK